jgi:2-methylcitrate dehydratase PrpD
MAAVAVAPHPTSSAIARRIARFALSFPVDRIDASLEAKIQTCIFDCLAGALAARDLSWSRQGAEYALALGDTGGTIIGESRTASWTEAAFANATMAHGLVQEDMHPASMSHIGVVVVPALLALGEEAHARGAELAAAVVIGYQVMARLGRAVVNKESARTFRPLGMIGAVAGAAAGARLARLSEDEAVHAVALAANTACGLNEWPRAGGTEIFFHAGFAARNAVASVLLARLGARASESAIEGPGGLLAAYRAPAEARHLFDDLNRELEIFAVYHKPAPACNFAQTAAQAALGVGDKASFTLEEIRTIRVKSFPEAIAYPGCDHAGPYASLLQAKMSIQFAVAAGLATGCLTEESFRELADPGINALTRKIVLESDAEFARAFPAKQGAEVIVELKGGQRIAARLDDLVPLDAEAVRARFRGAATKVFGEARGAELEARIDALMRCADVAELARGLRG